MNKKGQHLSVVSDDNDKPTIREKGREPYTHLLLQIRNGPVQFFWELEDAVAFRAVADYKRGNAGVAIVSPDGSEWIFRTEEILFMRRMTAKQAEVALAAAKAQQEAQETERKRVETLQKEQLLRQGRVVTAG
jgi:hypothetical protein